MISIERLQARRAELTKERDRATATLNAIAGAINVLDEFIQEAAGAAAGAGQKGSTAEKKSAKNSSASSLSA